MLQARFDSACSWTVLGSASYRPRPLAPAKAEFNIEQENCEILNLETSADEFIRRLSWNLQCDTEVPFHEKRRMVPK
jgi:hypothetical protein